MKRSFLGTIRIHPDGSAGSHNGAKSVIGSIGTQDLRGSARLRAGSSAEQPQEYVLRPMKKAELEIAAEMIGEAGDAVEMILKQGIDAAMNQYNRRKARSPEEPEESKDDIAGPCAREWKERGHYGRTLYDLVFIVRPATPEEEIKKVLTVIEHTCAEKGARSRRRELGNAEAGVSRGQTPRRDLHSPGDSYHARRADAELERRLRVQDNVIKYQTVRLDEDLKRQKKLTLKREKRAARRPRRTAAPPAAAPAPAPEQAAATS